MKMFATFAILTALSFSAQATDFALTVYSCDKVEGDTSTETHIGSYNGVLPEKLGSQSIVYKDGDLEITGTFTTYKEGQRKILAQAKIQGFEPMKLMVRMVEENKTVASAGFCETKEDEGKLILTFISFK